jgi:hypothetical protein
MHSWYTAIQVQVQVQVQAQVQVQVEVLVKKLRRGPNLKFQISNLEHQKSNSTGAFWGRGAGALLAPPREKCTTEPPEVRMFNSQTETLELGFQSFQSVIET